MSLLERLPPPPTRFAFPGEPSAWGRRAQPMADTERYYLPATRSPPTASPACSSPPWSTRPAMSRSASLPAPPAPPASRRPTEPPPSPIQARDWVGLDAAMWPFKGAEGVAFDRMTLGSFLPPVRSPDAALRALGQRELCLWMDEND